MNVRKKLISISTICSCVICSDMFFPPVSVLNESAKGPVDLWADMLWQKSPFRLIFHNLTQTSFISTPGMNRICYFSFPFWTLTDSGFPQQLAWLSLLWVLANRTPNLSPILSDVSRVPDSVSNLLTGQRIWLAGVFDQEIKWRWSSITCYPFPL